MEKAIAVEVELKERWYSMAGGDSELPVAIRAAGHVDTVPEEVQSTHHHVLGVPRETQVKVT